MNEKVRSIDRRSKDRSNGPMGAEKLTTYNSAGERTGAIDREHVQSTPHAWRGYPPARLQPGVHLVGHG